MLAIRLQRTGRKGLAQYRVVVQEARLSPTSGRVVATLGSYNPHTKQVTVTKDKAEFYLTHGAQPSPRVAALLKSEGVKLPKWVAEPVKKEKAIRNVEKLRKNRPAEAPAPEKTEEPAAEVAEVPEETAEASSEAPVEAEATSEAEKPAEEQVSTEEKTEEKA